MMVKTRLLASLAVLALTLTACGSRLEVDPAPNPEFQAGLDELARLKEEGIELNAPSIGEFETMAKDTVCPILRSESATRAYEMAIEELQSQFGLSPEGAKVITEVGGSIWCPDDYTSVTK